MADPNEIMQDLARVIRSFPLIESPEDRETFKRTSSSLRKEAVWAPPIHLREYPLADFCALGDRRNTRQFVRGTVRKDQLERIFWPLKSTAPMTHLRRQNYASASAMYAVQTYLIVHDRGGLSCVEEMEAGSYYFQPSEFALYKIDPAARISATSIAPINRAVLSGAAFSLFFVGDLSLVLPLYGASALLYASIEAGLMTQLVDQGAVAAGLGLCHIGSAEPAALRKAFALHDGHMPIHCLFGGVPRTDA